MESNIEDVVLKYINRHYVIKHNRYFNIVSNIQEWGRDITNAICKIFSVEKELGETIFTCWASSKGLTAGEIYDAFGRIKLKVSWSPEAQQDLQAFHGIDAEAELLSVLTEEITKEIDSQILQDLKPYIRSSNDFLGVLRCVGYDVSPTIYDPQTFMPIKKFVPMKYDDVENEKQNNIIWQNWVRTREQNQKA